jgi:hypothetical protein
VSNLCKYILAISHPVKLSIRIAADFVLLMDTLWLPFPIRLSNWYWLRGEIERVDDETKWVALTLMLGASSSVVALAKKIVKPETKTVTYTVAVPKTKIVNQQPQQPTTPEDKQRTDFTPIRPATVTKSIRKPKKTLKTSQRCTFYSCLIVWLTQDLLVL